MNWIIDDSGTKADVCKRVGALTYASFRSELENRHEKVKAEVLVDNGKPSPQFPLARATAEDLARRLAAMDDDDEAIFERTKAFVLLHLAAARTSHVGVCARLVSNPSDAPDGQTLSIHMSEYAGP